MLKRLVVSLALILTASPALAQATQQVPVSLLCQGVEDATTGNVNLVVGIASDGQRGRLFLGSSDLRGRDLRLVNQPYNLQWRREAGGVIVYRSVNSKDQIELRARQLPNGSIVGQVSAILGGEGYGASRMTCVTQALFSYRGAPILFGY